MKTLLLSLVYFTRIPIGNWVAHDELESRKIIRFLPLIGILVGLVGALVLYLFQLVSNFEIAIILSMVSTILFTGAFHEDGLADTCDGFGGGWNKEQVLTIMKDSRIGTYGTIGLVMILLMKFQLLSSLTPGKIYVSLIAAHALSRITPVLIVNTSFYASLPEQSKSRNVVYQIKWQDLLVASIFGVLPFYFLTWEAFIISILLVGIVVFLTRWYSLKRIGGYTGDVLGASQQISEIGIYLVFLYIQDFI